MFECVFHIYIEQINNRNNVLFQIVHHNFRIRLALSASYHILYISALSMFFCRNDGPHFHHDNIGICKIFHSKVSAKNDIKEKQKNKWLIKLKSVWIAMCWLRVCYLIQINHISNAYFSIWGLSARQLTECLYENTN